MSISNPSLQLGSLKLAKAFKEKNWSTKLYSGVEASEQNFKSLSGINSPTILHIATHGYFVKDYEINENPNAVTNYKENPLLRSGILLHA